MFATGTPNWVQRFTHIHPLTEFDFGTTAFTCDGCETYGSGKAYRCGGCNYDVHDYCATCPTTLRTFMDPLHELRLFSQVTRWRRCVCDLCEESIEGMYYRCELCDFDVHPLCTKLPQHMSHVLHPDHTLELSRTGEGTCVVCRKTCQSWRYRCGACGFNVHMGCLSEARGTPSTAQTQEREFGYHPHHQQQPFGYHPYHQQQPYPYYYHHHYPPHGYPVQAGPGHGSGFGVGRKIYSILTALTIGVVCNIVAAPASDCVMAMFCG